MKHSWLFLAGSVLLALWTNDTRATLFLMIIVCGFHYKRFSKHLIFYVLLLLCMLRISLPTSIQQPTQDVYLVKEVKSSYVILKQGSQLVIAYGLEGVHPKDVVEVTGSYEEIDSIHNFDSFYFPTWCHRRGIYYGIQVDTYDLKEEGSGLAHALYVHVQQIEEPHKTFLNQMLYGIYEEDVTYFVTSSGLHIITISYMLKKFLTLFFDDRKADLICFGCIGVIAYLTVFSNTIMRILCFQWIRFLFPKMERKDRFGVSILVVLMISPFMAFELSLLIPVAFQFVALFQQVRLPKKVQSILVLAPLQFYFLHQVSFLTMFFFQPLRYFYAGCYILAWISCVLPFPLLLPTSIMGVINQLLEQEPAIYDATPLWWLLLYGMILMKYVTYQRRKDCFLLIGLLCFTQVHGYLDPFAKILILDVGQGDCALIIYPYQERVVMIDAMGSLYKDIPNDIILPILNRYHINTIDTLIVTHQDMDHSGGVEELAKHVTIKQLIDSKEKASAYLADNLTFLALEYEGSDENENSIVSLLEFYDTTMLFMGDAGYGAEQAILQQYPKLSVDILKAGHHGSKTSTSPAFLHQVQPCLTFISAGRNNRYRHPHQEVLDLLESEGSKTAVTSKNGAIRVQICKYFAFYRTADNEFGIIKVR